MRLVITGASGQLGTRLVKAACQAGFHVHAWTSPRVPVTSPTFDRIHYAAVELTNPEDVAHAFWQARPMAVIHAAAISSIAECYRDPVRAFRINAEATRQLVGLCVAGVSRLVYVSTDLVFDGKAGNYGEGATAQPLSQYGKSKLDGERAVLHHPGHLVARLSWLVGRGPANRPNFLDLQASSLRTGQTVDLFDDEWRTPIGVDTAAQALLALACSDHSGLVHLGGPERLSRHQMGCILAKVLGCDTGLVKAVSQQSLKVPEPRPHDVSLNSTRWRSWFPQLPWPTYEAVLREEWSLR